MSMSGSILGLQNLGFASNKVQQRWRSTIFFGRDLMRYVIAMPCNSTDYSKNWENSHQWLFCLYIIIFWVVTRIFPPLQQRWLESLRVNLITTTPFFLFSTPSLLCSPVSSIYSSKGSLTLIDLSHLISGHHVSRAWNRNSPRDLG